MPNQVLITEPALNVVEVSITGSSTPNSVAVTETNNEITINTTSGGGGGTITNLSSTADSTTVTVQSSDGTNATLSTASGSVAGIITSGQWSKLDGIDAGAEVNTALIDSDTMEGALATNVASAESVKAYVDAITYVDSDAVDAINATSNITTTCDTPNVVQTDVAGNAGTVTDGVYTTSSVGVLTDVDTSSVAANDILVWNGSSFVVESMNALVTNNYLFTFSVTSFSDGISATQLIGTGDWKAADALTYTAVYVAGPPSTSATIQKAINSTSSYSDVNSMVASAFTSGTNDAAIAYPSARDQYLRFRLKVVDGGATTYTEDAAKIYFKNYIYYGASTSTSLDEAGIEGLSGSTISSSFTSPRSVNSSEDKFIYLAYPSGYTDIHTDGFKFNGITCPFEAKVIVEDVENSAGYTEDYDVYRSTNPNLGDHTLNLSTSATLINHIFCGVSTSANPDSVAIGSGGFASVNQTIASNDIIRTWSSVTPGSGEYIMFAWPADSRIDTESETTSQTPTFTIGVLPGGFSESTSSPQDYTNANGYTESYKIFVSNNANLGASIVITS